MRLCKFEFQINSKCWRQEADDRALVSLGSGNGCICRELRLGPLETFECCETMRTCLCWVPGDAVLQFLDHVARPDRRTRHICFSLTTAGCFQSLMKLTDDNSYQWSRHCIVLLGRMVWRGKVILVSLFSLASLGYSDRIISIFFSLPPPIQPPLNPPQIANIQ